MLCVWLRRTEAQNPRVGRHFRDDESVAMAVRGMTDCDGLDSAALDYEFVGSPLRLHTAAPYASVGGRERLALPAEALPSRLRPATYRGTLAGLPIP